MNRHIRLITVEDLARAGIGAMDSPKVDRRRRRRKLGQGRPEGGVGEYARSIAMDIWTVSMGTGAAASASMSG